MKKLFVVLVSFVLITLLLTGCSAKATDKEVKPVNKEKLKFAYIAMHLAAPQALINQEYNIFEQQLQKWVETVEFVATRSLDNIWPLMDQDEGDPDFVYLPSANFSTYITETSRFGGSNKYVIVAGSINTNTTVLITAPGINSLKDLDGKTVGVANKRYSDAYQLNEMLETVGLATKSAGGTVEVIYDDIIRDEIENFATGKYDAIIIYAPMNFKLALDKVPGSKILTTMNPNGMFGQKQPRNWLLVKKELLENNRELVRQVLKAHVLATDKSKEEKDKLPAINREVFINYFKEQGIDVTQISKDYTLEFYQKKWQEAETTYDPNMEFVTGVFDFMEQKGLVKGKSIDDFVQINLFNEVLKEMGREPIN